MTFVARLDHRTHLRIAGPDWASFLKGLCTAHIDRISTAADSGAPARLHYGAFLRPQGKLYADCLIRPVAPDEVWLDVPLSAHDELLSRLNMYRLRARVTIEAIKAPVWVAFGGPLPPDFVRDSRCDIIGAEFGFSHTDQTENSDAEDWAAFRMGLGLSDPGTDFGMDALYAIDANLDALDAIDFHKGCYVGQELTSRMKRRGQIKTRILPFKFSGAPPVNGSEILTGDRRAGEVLATAQSHGLAVMRLDRLAEGLTCNDQPIVIMVPEWMTNFVTTLVSQNS